MALQPIFIALTIFGNLVIIGSAYLLYKIENGVNPNIDSYLDTLWWSVATVTTVGYGDVIPITDTGRILGIGTIVIGAALFWSYTALFAEALISKDITDVEAELRSFSRTLKTLEKNELAEKDEVRALIDQIKNQLK